MRKLTSNHILNRFDKRSVVETSKNSSLEPNLKTQLFLKTNNNEIRQELVKLWTDTTEAVKT